VIEEDAQTSETLREAFDQHYAALVRLCLALGESREDAEDMVQEAFVRAMPSLETVEPAAIRSYLRKTILNLRKDRRRAAARVRLFGRQGHADERGILEERDELWRALQRLPERQRACVVLRFYEDLPEREVAELLRCSVGTVKSQTHKGLEKLRQEVER
jgi:RNA polymerase sigma-70 factor (sigma-E family)